ncbi:MAG: hypothetical protein WBP81_24710 [Solirubrobacteraceae bacterium]
MRARSSGHCAVLLVKPEDAPSGPSPILVADPGRRDHRRRDHGLLVLSPWLISGQVTGSVHEFGPIGTTFVLDTWLLILSTLVVAGTISGAAIVSRREVHTQPLSSDPD